MELRCRCCLASTKGTYYSLLSVFPNIGRNGSTLLDVLRTVMSSPVIYSEDLPTEICQGCLKSLKAAFGFIIVFKNSEMYLQQRAKKTEKYNLDKKKDMKAEEENKNLETIIIKDISNVETKKEIATEPSQAEEVIIFSDELTLEEILARYDKDVKGQTVLGNKAERKNDIVSLNIEKHVSVNDGDEPKNVYSETNEPELSDGKEDIDENFQKEILDMERNRERNKSNIIIMTIEDVLKDEKRKSREQNLAVPKDGIVDVIQTRKYIRRDQKSHVFICDVCNRVFHSKRNLCFHKYGVHNPNWKEKFKCTVCGLQSKTISALKHHMLKHNEKKYECHLCGKSYMVKQHLVVHIKSKHETSYDNKYLCPSCGKGFKSSSGLTYHLRIHSNQRNYACQYCGFRCLTLSAMKRHERIHTGERPFNCRYCDKTFAGTPERQSHENIHKGVMPYKCRYCNKHFGQTYNMKVHTMQHGGDKACNLCSRAFIDEEVLKFHYRHKHKVTMRIGAQSGNESE